MRMKHSLLAALVALPAAGQRVIEIDGDGNRHYPPDLKDLEIPSLGSRRYKPRAETDEKTRERRYRRHRRV